MNKEEFKDLIIDIMNEYHNRGVSAYEAAERIVSLSAEYEKDQRDDNFWEE